ncbi:hypothetical protein ACIF83_18860 [Streptomyces sp. NPDC085866]|uniref:hypothetical protein n=1 Tax=Streptomyces sp. NPDC085866 TaxID=3365736 RepID=UPI0037D4E097
MMHADTGFALTGAVVLALVAGGVSAVGASTAPEQFPVAGRLGDLAVGTVATTIFGGLAPYPAQTLSESTGRRLVPGVMAAVVALFASPALWRLPETAPSRLAIAENTGLRPDSCPPRQRRSRAHGSESGLVRPGSGAAPRASVG